jgi:hypothetical protein
MRLLGNIACSFGTTFKRAYYEFIEAVASTCGVDPATIVADAREPGINVLTRADRRGGRE